MDKEAWTRDTASHEKIMGMRSGVSTINGNAEPAVKPIASISLCFLLCAVLSFDTYYTYHEKSPLS